MDAAEELDDGSTGSGCASCPDAEERERQQHADARTRVGFEEEQDRLAVDRRFG